MPNSEHEMAEMVLPVFFLHAVVTVDLAKLGKPSQSTYLQSIRLPSGLYANNSTNIAALLAFRAASMLGCASLAFSAL